MPVATHDLTEIVEQLRTSLLADSGLTDLLGTTDAIYFGRPEIKPVYPIIVITINASNPQGDGGFTGLWRPDLQFDILGTLRADLREISGYLEANWSIPANKAAAVTSTNFVLTQLRHVNAIEAGEVRLTEDDKPVKLLASEWRARVTLRS